MESTDRQVARVLDWLIRHRTSVFLGCLLALAVAWPLALGLRFDRSIESFYSADDPVLQAFLASKRSFGNDEFVFVAYTDPQLLTEAGFERLRRFSEQLRRVPGVDPDGVQNLADALAPPRLPPVARRILKRLRQERMRELFRGILLGDDNQTTAVVLKLLDRDVSPVSRETTIADIRRLAAAHDPPAVVVGEPVQLNDMFRFIEQDASTLFWASLVLLGLVILALFRSPRWVALPLLVVVTAIVWTKAVLAASQMRLSMISSVLNALMTIIGIATVTHVTVRYREHRGRLGPREALRQSLHELVGPVFWSCATTAAGFLALLSSSILPVRSFATMMGIGTLFVFVAAFLILPGGILAWPGVADPKQTAVEPLLQNFLRTAVEWVDLRPRTLTAVAAVIVAASAAGLTRLEVETDFSRNFRKHSDIVRSLDFVETKLGGAGSWEVDFTAPAELDEECLHRLRRAARELRSLPDQGYDDLTKVLCLTDALDMIPTLPFLSSTLEKRRQLLQQLQPGFEKSFYNPKTRRMRILLRSYERRTAASKHRLIEKAEATVREVFPDAQATGMFVLLTFLIESLLRDQLVSFLLAAVSIGVMMTLALRSVRLALVSLVPNLCPIVFVVGTMGWLGLRVNIATAMIASVSMGLTIDSSIHYLTAYRRARRQGKSLLESLYQTHATVGRALVFANLALVVGFSVLTLSHFIPLIHFGILVSVAMLGGLAGNLFLLPLLVAWVDRRPETEPSTPAEEAVASSRSN